MIECEQFLVKKQIHFLQMNAMFSVKEEDHSNFDIFLLYRLYTFGNWVFHEHAS